MCRALMRPAILPPKLIVAVSSQCRLPRNLPSIKAERQTTLLLPRSPLRRQMDVSPRSNRAAETAGDFVVAQINMCAACRADCRGSRAADLLLPLTFETLDNRALLPFPKILKFAEDGGAGRGNRCFLADSQLKAGFWRKRRKIAATLATNRALGRRILHLLEATMWTFHTDFCRRRTGHRTLTPKIPFCISALRMLP